MMVSLAAYVAGVVFFHDAGPVVEKMLSRCRRRGPSTTTAGKAVATATYYGLAAVVKVLWPVFHFHRKVSYEKSANKAFHRQKLLDFDSVWNLVKTIEYGVEATVQLVLLLFLLKLLRSITMPSCIMIKNPTAKKTVMKVNLEYLDLV